MRFPVVDRDWRWPGQVLGDVSNLGMQALPWTESFFGEEEFVEH